MFMKYRKKSLPIKRIPNKSCSHFKYTVKPESRDINIGHFDLAEINFTCKKGNKNFAYKSKRRENMKKICTHAPSGTKRK